MKHKSFWQDIIVCAGIFLLISDRETAIAGAKAGLQQCLGSIIPTLLPFFLLSNLLLSLQFGSKFPLKIHLPGFPENGFSLLIPAFLGGYPAGARSAAEAWRSKSLSKENAERMLAYCSNAGPAFILGLIAPMFPQPWMAWSLWGIQVISALFTAALFSRDEIKLAECKCQTFNISGAMDTAIKAVCSVCGWVICFQILIACLVKRCTYLFPIWCQTALAGSLELVSGCCLLPAIPSLPVRYVVCSGMLSLGGLCVLLQTIAFTDGLSIRSYIKGKLIQTALSVILSASVILEMWPIPFVILCLFAVILPKCKKSSRIWSPGAV